MRLKFRIILNVKDDVLRDIIVDSSTSLLEFSKIISDQFGFDSTEISTFHISNENWEQDEYKALQNFCQESNLTYSVLAVSFFSKQVAVRVREQLSEPSRNKSCVASNHVQ